MNQMLKLIIIGLLGFVLIGCQNANKQNIGVLAGGAAGALLGSQFGQGSGQSVAIAAGAVAGAVLGGQVGNYMDKTDRLVMNQTLEKTRTGSVKSWRNPDTGNVYRVKPTRTYYKNSEPCREYTTTAWIGGKKQEIYGKACRMADGSWKIVK